MVDAAKAEFRGRPCQPRNMWWAPDGHRQEADGERRRDDHRVAKITFRENTGMISETMAKPGHEDVDLGVAEEPEEVLPT